MMNPSPSEYEDLEWHISVQSSIGRPSAVAFGFLGSGDDNIGIAESKVAAGEGT
jgi:hypothetical protein